MIAVLEENLHEAEMENTDNIGETATKISSYISRIKYNSIPALNERSVSSLYYDPFDSSRILTLHHVSTKCCLAVLKIRDAINIFFFVICRKEKPKTTIIFFAFGIFIIRGDRNSRLKVTAMFRAPASCPVIRRTL